jgi:hypothetical protein
MSEDTAARVHWSFWAISVFAFLWNVGGAMNYLGQMDPEMLASYPESHRAIIDGRPAWATGGFAIGVFGGALAALLLLLRRSIAFYVFIVSLVGVVLATVHTARIVQSHDGFTTSEIIIMTIMPVVVAAFLVWYAKLAQRKGWLS